MSLRRPPPNDPREWLTYAKSNLKHAADATTGVRLEDLCFDAQQAAEKAIKAVFVARKEAFPYIHNIEELLK
jgi:HEPN domain-containing protein